MNDLYVPIRLSAKIFTDYRVFTVNLICSNKSPVYIQNIQS